MVVFGGMMLFFIEVGGCGLAGSLESRKSDIGGMGMVVGNVNGLVGSLFLFECLRNTIWACFVECRGL